MSIDAKNDIPMANKSTKARGLVYKLVTMRDHS